MPVRLFADLALSCLITWVLMGVIEWWRPGAAMTSLPVHLLLLAAIVFWLIHVYKERV